MTIRERIQALEVNEVFEFAYGKTYNGEDRVFTFSCYDEYKGEKSYSVRAGNIFESMNVEKITDKYVSLYTFDMMGQRSTYKLPIDEMKVGVVVE